MSISQPKPNAELANAQASIAKHMFEKQVSDYNATKNNASIADATASAALQNAAVADASGAITASAQFAIASAFIHTWLYTNSPLIFNQNDKEIGRLNYRGDAWGLALGGGVLWATGWMNNPDSLVGDCNFAVTTNPVATGISFFQGATPVGILVAGGLNIQAGNAGGSGKFERA